jgi:hypothetical protein
MSDSMIPKDVLPLIGKYLEPKLYVLQIRIKDGNEHRFNIHAKNIEGAYTKIAENHELLNSIMDALGVCVLSDNEMHLYTMDLFGRIGTRMYKHCGVGVDTMRQKTLKNTFAEPCTYDEVVKLLSSTEYLKLYFGQRFSMRLHSETVY